MSGTERRENVTTPFGTIQRENFESFFFQFFKNIIQKYRSYFWNTHDENSCKGLQMQLEKKTIRIHCEKNLADYD